MTDEDKQKAYLTIHGHFYQPPRENPWLECIEEQPSAYPFHDWNERICYECYTPNSVARIIDNSNKIIDIVNNYSLISFNFGPTLIKWIQAYNIKTYERILEADKISQNLFSGHGNAIAQVFNHIIMPLANYKDKYTQVYWGIKDFEYRFKRKPEGLWLSEAAVCDETLSVLSDFGIKYTILSPYQADKVKYSYDSPWEDASRGNIDPTRAYRYNIKCNPGKHIDIFFYDGSISRSIAFDDILYNGDKFVNRIKDGIIPARGSSQLINLATDGESYGHHKVFGDMSLAYALKVKLEKEGLLLTNYSQYLEKFPPTAEVLIKDKTSWSCSHGLGRWKEDCGCSTGGKPGWNQAWRKPLRLSLDWLNEKLSQIYEKEAIRYFDDIWNARNDYIDVILEPTEERRTEFLKKHAIKNLSNFEIVDALKLLEMQKNSMYMYTSCGWFFTEISGIETIQILKYAARAIQLASEFGRQDIEKEFLNCLSEAKSNIKEFGNGEDIYNKFVKHSIISRKQVASHWAISSLFESYEDIAHVYSYIIKKHDYERSKKGSATLLIGRIELKSEVTTEISDMIFGLLHFGGENFHCVIRGFAGIVEYQKIKADLFDKFNTAPLTEVIRALDEHFGKEYWTIKDLFVDEKRNIISELIKEQLEEFSTLYYKIYNDSQSSIMQLLELGLTVPAEFKIAAEYTLSRKFNRSIEKSMDLSDIDSFKEAKDINNEAERLFIKINKKNAEEIFSRCISQLMCSFIEKMDINTCSKIIKIIEVAEELQIKITLDESQNLYFNKLNNYLTQFIENMSSSNTFITDKEFVSEALLLGEKLMFNLDKYYALLSKNLVGYKRI